MYCIQLSLESAFLWFYVACRCVCILNLLSSICTAYGMLCVCVCVCVCMGAIYGNVELSLHGTIYGNVNSGVLGAGLNSWDSSRFPGK